MNKLAGLGIRIAGSQIYFGYEKTTVHFYMNSGCVVRFQGLEPWAR